MSSEPQPEPSPAALPAGTARTRNEIDTKAALKPPQQGQEWIKGRCGTAVGRSIPFISRISPNFATLSPAPSRAALMQAHKSGERGIIASLTFKLEPNSGCGRFCATLTLGVCLAENRCGRLLVAAINPAAPLGNHSRDERWEIRMVVMMKESGGRAGVLVCAE